MGAEKLSDLRQKIRQIDDQIFTLVGERLRIVAEVGKVKLEENLPIKDYPAEKRILQTNLEIAKREGIFTDMAAELTRVLIEYSVLKQDEYHAKHKRTHNEQSKEILIIGGAGQMGQWCAQYLQSFGHKIVIYDAKAQPSSPFATTANWSESAQKADVIFLTTPIEQTADFIEQLADLRVKGLVIEICSIKSPIYDAVKEARAKGLRFASLHPLFGPKVEWLAGRNILVCEIEGSSDHEEARELFADSSAQLISVPFLKHDELMGYILGLSHLTSLVFSRTLATSGFSFADLQSVGSTTFNAQVDVSRSVAQENQKLYYEIQSSNSDTEKVIARLEQAVRDFAQSIRSKSSVEFIRLMDSCRNFYKSE